MPSPKQRAFMYRAAHGAFLVALFVAVVCMACVLVGCHLKPKPLDTSNQQQLNAQASAGIDTARKLNTVIQGSIEAAKPHTDDLGKGHLLAAQQTAQAQDAGLVKTAEATAAELKGLNETASKYADLLTKYEHLNDQWYVKVGQWIERALWTLAIIYVLLNAVCFFGGIGNPGGWLAFATKQLRLFLPGMNPSSWALNWVNKAKK